MQIATHLAPRHTEASEAVELSFDQREKSRLRATLLNGEAVGIQLRIGTMLSHGDKLALPDGRIVGVIAAQESLHEVRAANAQALAKIAYHVGNRHVPLQIESDYLLMLPDHVLKAMVEGLGGTVSAVTRGFQPESGAYGHSHVHHSHDDEGHGGRIHDGLQPRTQDR
ncbi:MAG: urease accessory protein UreE [Betaproteobacteria bacterium]|nr:MAG: urease accessory protein UreE [Betaproteobacteria bacterium]